MIIVCDVNQHRVDTSKCGASKLFLKILNTESLSYLLIKLDGLSICVGQSEMYTR